MPSLFDPNLKLQWAKKHLDALDVALKPSRNRSPMEFLRRMI
jgi:hypothetical protein